MLVYTWHMSNLWQRVDAKQASLTVDACRLRIYRYYLPVFFWVQEQVQAHKASGATSPLMVSM